jgi:hypothetical protein
LGFSCGGCLICAWSGNASSIAANAIGPIRRMPLLRDMLPTSFGGLVPGGRAVEQNETLRLTVQ